MKIYIVEFEQSGAREPKRFTVVAESAGRAIQEACREIEILPDCCRMNIWTTEAKRLLYAEILDKPQKSKL